MRLFPEKLWLVTVSIYDSSQRKFDAWGANFVYRTDRWGRTVIAAYVEQDN